MTDRWHFDREPCRHRQFRCLRCGNTGCDQPNCPGRGFDFMMCRSCGHIEKSPR